MFKKITVAIALLGLAAIAFSAFAPGASAAPLPPNLFLRGAGTLSAQGTGVAAVRGLVDYRATGAAGDILLVRDVAGDARIDVQGYNGTGEWRGFTVYFEFTGAITANGTDLAVIVVGQNIDLDATGRGWAYLRGNGQFQVNGGPSHPWDAAGGFASIAAEAAP